MASTSALRASCSHSMPSTSKAPVLAARAFSSFARTLAPPKGNGSSGTKTATKQSSGFGRKNKDKHVRKGGEMKVVAWEHPGLKNPNVPTSLPELADVDVSPALRYTPVALGTGKNSLLNAFGLPKSLETELSHLSQPFAVVRDVTLSSFERMQTAAQTSSAQNRFVYTGPTGSGKSVALLQTVEYCAKQGWFVIYVPKAIEWVNSTTAYQYDPRSQTFLQPALAGHILKQVATFNREVLASIPLPEDVVLERASLSAGTPLKALVDAGISDPTSAHSALKAVLDILAAQTTVPVLLAVDDFQALYGTTLYRDPQFKLIEALHLSMPRLVLEYASGKSAFARGAVVGALSTTNTSFPVPVELKDALGLTPAGASSTWSPRNPEYSGFSQGLVPIEVPAQFNVHEAAALVEVWAQTGSLHSDLNESVFLAKLAETGGNPREFLRRGYMSSLVAW